MGAPYAEPNFAVHTGASQVTRLTAALLWGSIGFWEVSPVFQRRSAKKRELLREALWPNSKAAIWPPTNGEGGWARVPRTLPSILCALTENVPGVDLGRTYLELLARTPEEGIVEIGSEEEHAVLAGFKATPRGIRSWRERVRSLEALGLIRVFGGSRAIDQVVMAHPRTVMERLREQGRVSDRTWNQYRKTLIDTTGKAASAPSEDGVTFET